MESSKQQQAVTEDGISINPDDNDSAIRHKKRSRFDADGEKSTSLVNSDDVGIKERGNIAKERMIVASDVDHERSSTENDNTIEDKISGKISKNRTKLQQKTVPEYGTQQYWENRYYTQFRGCHCVSHQQNPSEKEINCKNSNDESHTEYMLDESKVPYHSWYFDYSDLRSLILPLILGGKYEELSSDKGQQGCCDVADENDQIAPQDEANEPDSVKFFSKAQNGASIFDNNQIDDGKELDNVLTLKEIGDYVDSDSDENSRNIDEHYDDVEGEDSNSDGANEEYENMDDQDDDDNSEPEHRDGLARRGPIRVLEIGCGDVPLGVELLKDLHQLQTNSSDFLSLTKIVKTIVCTDYSQVLIDEMKQKNSCIRNAGGCNGSDHVKRSINEVDESISTEENANNATLSESILMTTTSLFNDERKALLQFDTIDARAFPNNYGDGSFELILDKGTLDAMLSDPINGVSGCIQIVSECARLLSPVSYPMNQSISKNESKSTQNNIELQLSPIAESASKDGYFVIVSHLNAHSDEGMEWLSEVVVAGLLQSSTDSSIQWMIEVHGNSPSLEDDGDDTTILSSTLGPAVYIIHKCRNCAKEILAPNEDGNDADCNNSELPTKDQVLEQSERSNSERNVLDIPKNAGRSIPIKFFSY